jgi:hypothetical protein
MNRVVGARRASVEGGHRACPERIGRKNLRGLRSDREVAAISARSRRKAPERADPATADEKHGDRKDEPRALRRRCDDVNGLLPTHGRLTGAYAPVLLVDPIEDGALPICSVVGFTSWGTGKLAARLSVSCRVQKYCPGPEVSKNLKFRLFVPSRSHHQGDDQARMVMAGGNNRRGKWRRCPQEVGGGTAVASLLAVAFRLFMQCRAFAGASRALVQSVVVVAS